MSLGFAESLHFLSSILQGEDDAQGHFTVQATFVPQAAAITVFAYLDHLGTLAIALLVRLQQMFWKESNQEVPVLCLFATAPIHPLLADC